MRAYLRNFKKFTFFLSVLLSILVVTEGVLDFFFWLEIYAKKRFETKTKISCFLGKKDTEP